MSTVLDRLNTRYALQKPAAKAGGPQQSGTQAEVIVENAVIENAPRKIGKSPWPSLEAYDEARRLCSQLHDLCTTSPTIGHYAASWLDAFCRAYNAGSVSNVRKAYCAIVEKWVVVEALVECSGVRGAKSTKSKSVSAGHAISPIGVAPWSGERKNVDDCSNTDAGEGWGETAGSIPATGGSLF